MNHVDAQNGVRRVDRPGGLAHIEIDGRQEVFAARLANPGPDAGQRFGRGVARLPAQIGDLFREELRVLPGAARHFEDEPRRWERSLQNFENRLSIALGRRRETFCHRDCIAHNVPSSKPGSKAGREG